MYFAAICLCVLTYYKRAQIPDTRRPPPKAIRGAKLRSLSQGVKKGFPGGPTGMLHTFTLIMKFSPGYRLLSLISYVQRVLRYSIVYFRC